ncbi:MAG TPA: GNAT family N-acetyltransferase [Actinomycetes bacterium]|nr:GNAT family N-acetyltransferase [Actinomycetes bacterium]
MTGPGEYRAWSATLATAFGETPSDERSDAYRPLNEWDRTIAAFDADRIVATGGTLSLELTLPGPVTARAGGLTAVAVLPTHRRRGLLRAIIAWHFADCQARGETLSVLGASEAGIYGRFGYGPATLQATTRSTLAGRCSAAHPHPSAGCGSSTPARPGGSCPSCTTGTGSASQGR